MLVSLILISAPPLSLYHTHTHSTCIYARTHTLFPSLSPSISPCLNLCHPSPSLYLSFNFILTNPFLTEGFPSAFKIGNYISSWLTRHYTGSLTVFHGPLSLGIKRALANSPTVNYFFETDVDDRGLFRRNGRRYSQCPLSSTSESIQGELAISDK